LSSAHVPVEKILQIIHYAAEGVGVRVTARLLNMHKDTVNNIIFKFGKYCVNFLSHMLKRLSLTEVQLDELWSFIKKESDNSAGPKSNSIKKKKKKKSQKGKNEHGKTWIWTALDASSHILISYYVGDRKLYDAKEMISDSSKRLIGKSIFTSVELIHYKTVLSYIFSKTQTISKLVSLDVPKIK
jgi:IS1 family transposase